MAKDLKMNVINVLKIPKCKQYQNFNPRTHLRTSSSGLLTKI